jgi:ABC-type multidrug transport system ATPase subunit
MSEHVIKTNSLVKEYKDFKAVDGLNLEVFKGDVFGFLGPNGAGKSTSIRMILGLIAPSSGSIELFGKPFNENRESSLRKIGAIVEKPDFYLYLSAYKNLEILGRLSGADTSKKHIESLLDLVGLGTRAQSKVETFSHGMKQRLGLAQALIHQPELIILDEPTTGLDPQGIKEMRELILHLSKDQGITIFHSSHLLHEVEMTSNRMMIMYKGKAIQSGLVSELLNANNLRVTFEVDLLEKAVGLFKERGLMERNINIEGNRITLDLTQEEIAPMNSLLLQHDIAVSAVIPVRSLEEYFLRITSEASNELVAKK